MIFFVSALVALAAINSPQPGHASPSLNSEALWNSWHNNHVKELRDGPDSLFRVLDGAQLRVGDKLFLEINPASGKWMKKPPSTGNGWISVEFDGKSAFLTPPDGMKINLTEKKSWKAPQRLLVSPGSPRENYIFVYTYDTEVSQYSEDMVPFYPFNPKAVVEATLVRQAAANDVKLKTTQGMEREYSLYGTATFTFAGKNLSLELYAPKTKEVKNLFIPFHDQTNGKSTYGGGRYLYVDLENPPTKKLSLDFNRAFNPFCVYTPYFDCPMISGNSLEVAIEAGAKMPPRKLH